MRQTHIKVPFYALCRSNPATNKRATDAIRLQQASSGAEYSKSPEGKARRTAAAKSHRYAKTLSLMELIK